MAEVLTAPVPKTVKTSAARATGIPLIAANRISRRVHQMGKQVSAMYAPIDTPLVLVVVLKGASVFAADLMRSLKIPAELEFIRAASYGGGTSSQGSVRLAHMIQGSLTGRHVLLVEDIVDSGRTSQAVIRSVKRMKPASLRLATLLDRPARREVPVAIDLKGFTIPDRFVIGYGLDYAGLYRELPAIYSLG
jgi:hypoxanthine phosphoribosyltransferase